MWSRLNHFETVRRFLADMWRHGSTCQQVCVVCGVCVCLCGVVCVRVCVCVCGVCALDALEDLR